MNDSKLHILVCLSSSPSSQRVIRAAQKLYHPEKDLFIALYVGSSETDAENDAELMRNFAFAKECGAQTQTIVSNDIALSVSEYARRIGATDLFIGSSAPSHFIQGPSIPEKITSYLPDTDIHIIPDPRSSAYPKTMKKGTERQWNIRDIFLLVSTMAAATLLSFWFDRSIFSNSNIITIYILAVLIVSVFSSHQVFGVIAAVLYILLFNFLFIEPRFTLLVYDPAYLVTYAVTVIAALITGTLAFRLKNIARTAAENAYQAKVLLDTSNQLEKAKDSSEMIRITCLQLSNLLKRPVGFYRADPEDPSVPVLEGLEGPDREAAAYSFANRQSAGAFTGVMQGCPGQYICVYTDDVTYGVLGIDMKERMFTDFENTILLSIINEFTLALNNDRAHLQKQEAEVEAEKEHYRAVLLRSISHDLRTPLTTICGNASNLEAGSGELTEEDRRQIYHDISEDASWLADQMENILSLTKLEDTHAVNLSYESIEDVIKEGLSHITKYAGGHRIIFDHPDEIIFAEMDPFLIIQVLVNLVNNAIKYTPPGTEIRISCEKKGSLVQVSVADSGNGIPDEDKAHIFELFYTGKTHSADSRRSMGIGLNLCYVIMQAHGQKIEVLDNQPRGTIFRFYLNAKEMDYEPGI